MYDDRLSNISYIAIKGVIWDLFCQLGYSSYVISLLSCLM